MAATGAAVYLSDMGDAEWKYAYAGDPRVILVRGTGKSFCAGADLKERRDMNAAQRAAHNTAINVFLNALANAPVPTIAVPARPAIK